MCGHHGHISLSQTHLQKEKEVNFIPQFGFYALVEIFLVSLNSLGKIHETHHNLNHMASMETLVQVINFATEKRGNIHGKAWILPRLSVFFPVETISSQ